MNRITRIYHKGQASYTSASATPTYQTARVKLGLLAANPTARQHLHDLQHKRLPAHMQNDRARTFLGLARLARTMHLHGNINVQQGLRDLMQILGYTDADKILGEVPDAGWSEPEKLYLRGLLRNPKA